MESQLQISIKTMESLEAPITAKTLWHNVVSALRIVSAPILLT